jgi:chemotaxis protein CheD
LKEPLKYFLLPGAIKVSSKPMEISTILGSCVSVCLWDKRLKQGGMNHFMMPLWNGNGLASPKYGNIAIEKLVDSMLRLGSNKDDLVAKVFGGAMVLKSSDCIYNIGARNIEVLNKVLSEKNIRIAGKSLGGSNGRKLIFNTETGVVKMKYINKE